MFWFPYFGAQNLELKGFKALLARKTPTVLGLTILCSLV